MDPKYVQMLEEANRTIDPLKRYELLAKAEAYLLEAQPVIPLLTRATDWMKKPYVKGMYPNPARCTRGSSSTSSTIPRSGTTACRTLAD